MFIAGENRCWCDSAQLSATVLVLLQSRIPLRKNRPPLAPRGSLLVLFADFSFEFSVDLSADLSVGFSVDFYVDLSVNLSVECSVIYFNRKGMDGPEPIFSSVVFNGSLQFFRDPAGALSEASRWLVEGGRIVIAHVQVRKPLGRDVCVWCVGVCALHRQCMCAATVYICRLQ